MEKKEIVAEMSVYDIDNTLVNLISQLNGYLDSVPDKYKSGCKIEVDTEESWGVPSISIEIYYYRQETSEEEYIRENEAILQQQRSLGNKRKQLEKLKRELGES